MLENLEVEYKIKGIEIGEKEVGNQEVLVSQEGR